MDSFTKIRLNNLAIRCFRDTADLDYIHARLAFKHHLYPQFLWSGLQALEKYGKSMLLQNLIKGKSIKHEILPSIKKFESEFNISIKFSDDVVSLIKRLDSRARFRYFESSDYSLSTDLVVLDRAVHEIRRFCQHFIRYNYMDKYENFNIKPEDEILTLSRMIELEQDFSDVKPVKIFGGTLERIIKDKTHPARCALVDNNTFFYAEKTNKIKVATVGGYSYTSQFELEPAIVNIAKEYIFIPKNVINGLVN